MPWKAKYNDKHNFVELVYLGKVTPQELHQALVAAVSLSKENNTQLFLADCTEMEGGHSVIDLYSLISLYDNIGLKLGMREALLMPSMQSPKADVEFYETACLNKGYNVRIFTDLDSAVKWLTRE